MHMRKSLRRRPASRRLRLENLERRLLLAADLDDEISEATSLGAASTTGATVSEAILPDTDVDMYKFTVTSNLVVDFDIDTAINGPGGLGSYLRLFNSSGTQLASNDNAFAPGESVLGFDAYLRHTFTSAGTYYIGVSNANNIEYSATTGNGDTAGGLNATGSYTLAIQALPIDTDDEISEAVVLGAISTAPVTANASIQPDVDVDMYKFSVNTNETVDFDVDTVDNGPDGLNSYVRIFNSQGEQLAFNNNGMAPGENLLGFDAFLRYTFTTRGNYYLAVSNATNTLFNATTGASDTAGGLYSVGAYTLTIQTAPEIPDDTDDEISEVPSQGAITTTVKTLTGTITPSVDVDMFRFTVTAGLVVDFDIDTTLNGSGGLGSYLRLFNSAGTQLAFNDNAIAPGENTLGFDAYLRYTFISAGTYYLGVSNLTNTTYSATTGNGDTEGGQHSTGDYTLNMVALPVDDDDDISEALSLGLITKTPDTISDAIVTDIDVDLIGFRVNSGQIVDFDLDTTENGAGGLNSLLRLFDATGQQLTINNNAAAPGELVVGFDAYLRHTFTSAGTYYIGVSNFNNATYDPQDGTGDSAGGLYSIGSYQLTIQTAADTPVDTDDELSEATILGSITTTPRTASAAITPDVDVDMYRFTVTAGQVVDFDIDTPLNGPGGLGSYIRLFNSQGTQLASNNNGTAPGENTLGFDAYLRYTFTSNGTYYLGVSNSNNTQYNPSSGDNDTAGGNNTVGSYDLIIQALPVDGDDTMGEAKILAAVSTAPQTLSDSIVTDIDVDMYRFTVTAGQFVGFDIDTDLNGTGGLGSFLRLFDSQGQQLAFNNNGAAPGETELGIDAYLQYTFTARGTYYLGVSNSNNILYDPDLGTGDTAGGNDSIGDYRLTVQAIVTGAPELLLSVSPTTIREDGGTATVTVTRNNGDDSQALVVSLASNDTTEASVPTTVTIPANSTSATFIVTGVDDALLDGTQTATISATATDYTGDTVSVQVSDHETVTITINPGSLSENGGTAVGTATRSNTDISSSLVISLSSSDTTEATVPNLVVIPAGQAFVTFTVTGQDDNLVDGTQTVTINVSATNYFGIGSTVDVTDFESLVVSITPASISENGGSATGTVSRPAGSGLQAITVSLSSSDASEATVPSSVTILANQTSASFAVSAVDDALLDGTQTVTITASTAGLANGTGTVNVTDLETLSLTISPTAINENGGVATGTVTRSSTNNNSALLVTLASSDTGEATVPASVTIPAGAASANFTITGVDDVLSDRTQSVVITATGAGFVGTSAGIDVLDDEPVLTLTLANDLLAENGGTVTGTVTRSALNLSAPLVVSLASSDTSEAVVPATVTIPANQSSAVFVISGVDDAASDGVQTVAISVSSAGYVGDAKNVLVADNERPYQNPRNNVDVDGTTFVTPLDALLIVNILNSLGRGPAATIMASYTGPAQFPDTNGDNQISPLDALLIINYLNARSGAGEGEGQGEGEGASNFGVTADGNETTGSNALAPALVDAAHSQLDWLWTDPSGNSVLRDQAQLRRKRI